MWSSDRFSSKENILRINITGVCPSGAWVLYGYTEGGEKKELRREKIANANGKGEFSLTHDFDPVSYGVYEGAVEFSVVVECSDGDKCECSGDKCEITKFEVSAPTLEHGEGGGRRAKFDGDRVAIYDLDGKELFVPYVPKKVLFFGNSILVGMFMSYGMCATAKEKDYASTVSREILSRSPDSSFTRIHSSPFEHSVSVTDFEKWFFDEVNITAGKRVVDCLEPDVDLIIIQLMDNVNTLEKVEAFKYNAPRFIEEIKSRSPRARIIWVYGWYGSDLTFSLAQEVCDRYKLESVNVAKLHTRAGEAYSGQVSIDPSGNEVVVKDLWISHPGDTGMAAISKKMIDQLFPEKL